MTDEKCENDESHNFPANVCVYDKIYSGYNRKYVQWLRNEKVYYHDD
jgi:hypothetical protein